MLATLQQYIAANERLDTAGVKRVWPTVDGRKLAEMEKSFADLREYRLQLLRADVSIAGDAATARCEVAQSFTPKAGRAVSRNTSFVFRLAKSPNSWVIASVETR